MYITHNVKTSGFKIQAKPRLGLLVNSGASHYIDFDYCINLHVMLFILLENKPHFYCHLRTVNYFSFIFNTEIISKELGRYTSFKNVKMPKQYF